VNHDRCSPGEQELINRNSNRFLTSATRHSTEFPTMELPIAIA
jgi:hypothetical protein